MKRSVFRLLFGAMLTFGALVGLLFPPFARVALDSTKALSLTFWLMCIAAGLLVGLANFWLFNLFVSRELRRIVQGMQRVYKDVTAAIVKDQPYEEKLWQLEVSSDDDIGEVAKAYNNMSQAIDDRLKREGDMRSLMGTLSGTVELGEVSRIIIDSLIATLDAEAGVLYGAMDGELELLCDRGIDQGESLPFRINASTQGPTGQAIVSGEIMTLAQAEDGLEWMTLTTPLGQFRPKGVTLVPLLAEQQTVGLAVLACRHPSLFPTKAKQIQTRRALVAPYLQNAILHRKIEEMATIDDLTGLMNRRFGMQRLQEEFAQAQRYGKSLSVLMVDIDHFKSINDTHGHAAGDMVLKKMGSSLTQHMRAGETACRYGGEEFLLILPATDLHTAAVIAERLRKVAAETKTVWQTKPIIVTLSIGAACWPTLHVNEIEGLVNAADQALYAAKGAGRNRVAINTNGVISPYRAGSDMNQATPDATGKV